MTDDLRARIARTKTTAAWLNLRPDSGRRNRIEFLLNEASMHVDRAENALEQAQAIINEPATTEPFDGGVRILREQVQSRSSETVRGEVYRR